MTILSTHAGHRDGAASGAPGEVVERLVAWVTARVDHPPSGSAMDDLPLTLRASLIR